MNDQEQNTADIAKARASFEWLRQRAEQERNDNGMHLYAEALQLCDTLAAREQVAQELNERFAQWRAEDARIDAAEAAELARIDASLKHETVTDRILRMVGLGKR